MRDLLPPPVFESIHNRLRDVGNSAASGWKSNKEEEDSLTGDLGRQLCIGAQGPIYVNGRPWQWSIQYKKFRGRGHGALESTIGADGIIQIEAKVRGIDHFKGVLFQAKKENRLRNSELREQVEKIEKAAPGGSAVILYSPTGYQAIKGSAYLNSEEGLVGPTRKRMHPLASFFDDFLECRNGLRGMYYEAVRERLLLPTTDGQIKSVQLEVHHRMQIQIVNS